MLENKIFFTLVFLVIIQRLFELNLSRKNTLRILASGGFEHAPRHYNFMVALHSLWLLAMILEVKLLDRPFIILLALPGFILFILGQCLRVIAIAELKDRWTTRILVSPQKPLVKTGIYKYLKHPNYYGVILEITFLPLIHSAYITALIFSLLNLLLLRVRISQEEAVLKENNGSL